MLVRPNQTVVEGTVKAIRPQPEGWGAEIDLEVQRNLSPVPEDDFLKPQPGRTLTAFSVEPHTLRVGEAVRLRLALLAGPRGGAPLSRLSNRWRTSR